MAKGNKKEKRIPVENLMGYDYIICEFVLCTFNLLGDERWRQRFFYRVERYFYWVVGAWGGVILNFGIFFKAKNNFL